MEITRNSKVKELYENPVGHDILHKLLMQLGKSDRLLYNPMIANLKVSTLQRFVKKKLGEDFIDTFLELLNIEKDRPLPGECEETKAWWKEAVFYQIYPRSFMDSNGDGIGDLNGIRMRLDYLKDLGVDCLWLSPVYDSPNDDNGYDIRDYRKIMKEFGTEENFDFLLHEVHERGMRLIMDLVVNHTSDEHPWFQTALQHPDSKERNYYFLKEGTKEQKPNNWTSFFQGSAWNFYEDAGLWGLHLFSKKQMDLNWDNPEVRKEVKDIVEWWLQKGVDGFRMDVINFISKKPELPNGNHSIGSMMGITGIEHYFYGPRLHELKVNAFEPYQGFNVGETPGIGMEMAKLLTGEHRREMDMIFNFDHLETPGHVRFDEYQYDLNYYKMYIMDWMKNYGNHCRMSLFFENHDNPRMISKVNKESQYRDVLGKLLAVLQLTLHGTPFIFQGQELGAIDQKFESIEDFRDVESINFYEEMKQNLGSEKALAKVLAGSRDHARVPMLWSQKENGGFSTGKPWIEAKGKDLGYSAEEQRKNPDSILSFYRTLLQWRRGKESILYGEIEFRMVEKKNYFSYMRRNQQGETYLIECNLSDKELKGVKNKEGKLLFSNYQNQTACLKPYEANIYDMN